MDPITLSAIAGFAGSALSSRNAARAAASDRDLQLMGMTQAHDMFKEQMRRYDHELHYKRIYENEDYARSLTAPAAQMKNVIDMAGQNGLHPLAALGVAPNYQAAGQSMSGIPSGTPGSPSPVGDNGSSAMLGDAISALASGLDKEKRQAEKDAAARQSKLEDAQIANIEAQTAELQAATSRTRLNTLRETTRGTKNTTGTNMEGEEKPLFENVVTDDGSVIRVPVGPDIDEVLSGGVIYVYDKVRDAWISKPAKSPAKKLPKRGSQPVPVQQVKKPSHRKPIKR